MGAHGAHLHGCAAPDAATSPRSGASSSRWTRGMTPSGPAAQPRSSSGPHSPPRSTSGRSKTASVLASTGWARGHTPMATTLRTTTRLHQSRSHSRTSARGRASLADPSSVPATTSPTERIPSVHLTTTSRPRRSATGLVTAVAALALLAGCSPAAVAPSATLAADAATPVAATPAPVSTEPVTIEYFNFTAGADHEDDLQAIIDGFQKRTRPSRSRPRTHPTTSTSRR